VSNAVYNRIRGLQIKPTEKSIIMALANIADDTGSTRLFASVDRLVYETCFTERTVRDTLKSLEQAGLIKIKRRTGGLSTYAINPDLSAKPYESIENNDFDDDLQFNAEKVQLNAPLHLMQNNCSQMQGGGASNADDLQFNSENRLLAAPYTSTSITSYTSIHQGEPVEQKQTKPKKAKVDPLAIDLPPTIDKKTWAEFIAMRKDIKKPVNTERMVTGLLNQLAKMQNPNASLQQSIDNCWTGVFAVKGGSAYAQQPSQPVQAAVEPLTQPIKHKYATHDTVADPAALARLRSML